MAFVIAIVYASRKREMMPQIAIHRSLRRLFSVKPLWSSCAPFLLLSRCSRILDEEQPSNDLKRFADASLLAKQIAISKFTAFHWVAAAERAATFLVLKPA